MALPAAGTGPGGPRDSTVGTGKPRSDVKTAIVLLLAMVLGVVPAAAQQPILGGNPLVRAVLDRDLSQAKALLLSGNAPQGRDLNRRPMLDLLLAYGANANETDAQGNSPLSHAAALGSIDAVERLIAAGVQLDWANQQGMTPLMRAAQVGANAIVRRLIDAGALVDLTDFTGRDALAWAETNGHQRAAAMLRTALAAGS
jgi:ankyrin repeat protein